MAILAIVSTNSAFAAPITFNTALPVSEDEFILREQFIYTDFSGLDTDINSLTALTVGGYGITSKWSVFGVLPVTHIETSAGSLNSDAFGLGDATLFTRYEIFRKDGRGATTRLAPLFGVRVPTGVSGETSDGSTDIFGGLIATIATTKYNIGSQLVYTANGDSAGFEAGDTIAFDASLQYRAWDGNLKADTPSFLFAVIEGNVTQQGNTRLNGTQIEDTDGTRLSISPGLQLVTQRWIADLAVTIPIADNFGAATIEPNFAVQTSISVNF